MLLWPKVMTILSVLQCGVNLLLSHRKMHDAGNDEGTLKWMESQNRGDKWQEASVYIKHDQPFWVRNS